MKHPRLTSLFFAALGAGMVVAGGFLSAWTKDWFAATLLTVGAAVALTVAFYWLNRTFDTALKNVERRVETAERKVEEVDEGIQDVRQEVANQRYDLEQLLRERLAPENHEVAQLFVNAAESRTATGLIAAIDTARQKGSLGSKAPVVPLRGVEQQNFVVRVDTRGGQLTLQLGRTKGALPKVDPILVSDETLVDSLEVLGTQVQDAAGDVHPEPWRIFEDVVDLLRLGRSREARKTLFARVGDWGACIGHMVTLGDQEPPVSVRAGRNPSNAHWNVPKGLTQDQTADFFKAQTLVLDSQSMFFHK